MHLSWVGLEIENALIERVLGEGGFSVVYLAVRDGQPLAFKVAHPESEVAVEQKTGCFNTLAQAPASSGIADIAPQPNHVLSAQYARLKSIDSEGMIKPLGASEVTGIFYYTMPALDGPSLRMKMQDKSAPLTHYLEQVARTCATLVQQDEFHGDLKPDNIILSEGGAVLIDPGYFGPLVVTGVKIQQCSITTPAYYPLYSPDDLLSLGIMLWELVMGKQPFASRGFSGRSDLSRCGPQLVEFVQDLEKVGRYAFSAILDLRFPKELRPQLTDQQEHCLLQSLRLKRSRSNQLELSEGFGSFYEFAEAIKPLRLCVREL